MSETTHATQQDFAGQLPEADGLCGNCHERQGTEPWVGEGGTLAYVHGMFSMWCKRCTLKAQIEHSEACAARLPALREQLEQELRQP